MKKNKDALNLAEKPLRSIKSADPFLVDLCIIDLHKQCESLVKHLSNNK